MVVGKSSATNSIQNAVSAISQKKKLSAFLLYPAFPRLFPLDTWPPSLSKTREFKVENKDKMLYLKHDPKWSKMLYLQLKPLVYPVILSQIYFVWKVSFSGVVCENTCHCRSSAAEKRIKNKMPNLD